MKNIVLVLVSMTLLAPMAAPAKPYHSTSVRWIVETRNNINEDDKYVTLVGHVTRRISDEEYWFTDGTGSIRLDSENFDLPLHRRIVIGGRIDQAYLGIGHVEVDVRHWHLAPLPRKVAPGAPAPTAPVTHTAPPPPAPKPHEAATPPPAPAPAPTPVVTTPPPAPPAAPPTPTTSTTMNPAAAVTPAAATTPATPSTTPPPDATTNAPAK